MHNKQSRLSVIRISLGTLQHENLSPSTAQETKNKTLRPDFKTASLPFVPWFLPRPTAEANSRLRWSIDFNWLREFVEFVQVQIILPTNEYKSYIRTLASAWQLHVYHPHYASVVLLLAAWCCSSTCWYIYMHCLHCCFVFVAPFCVCFFVWVTTASFCGWLQLYTTITI